MTVWGERIPGPKNRIGNGVLKQEGSCSQSMGRGKLVTAGDETAPEKQVGARSVPRITDAVWKAKREMATSEMWLRKPLASRVEDGFKFSRSEDGGGGSFWWSSLTPC